MAEKIAKELTPEMVSVLQKERLVFLGTVDHETKGPDVHAISWVYASAPRTIRFAVDNRSRILENIRQQPQTTMTLFLQGSVYTISGKAHIMEEKMEGVPIPLAKVELVISKVRNVMFHGSRISQEPLYEKTYDQEAARRLDNQVMEGLKKA